MFAVNGLTYTRAPVEAQAQCALLEETELVDRVVTGLVASMSTGTVDSVAFDIVAVSGLPHVIASMEAEPQCAWLHEAKLVDSVVIEDCVAFLFGVQHVYRCCCTYQ